MNTNHSDSKLDALLTKHLARDDQAADASAARVYAALNAKPLPRQHRDFVWRWPSVLLDLDFAPAWTRVAALACCAALGFLIGIAGLDGQFDPAGAAPFASRSDVSPIDFEPEPLTGLRP
ncbi:MAG: hypothetical protein WCI56_01990 [Hyphomicrobiales bacterium]